MSGREMRHFTVFVGGPGDCDSFKMLAKKAAGEMNRLVGKDRGISLEVVTSDDVNKMQGVPQDQINTELIDSCHAFLTFFSARYGTPTGNSESGSVEEFERIYARTNDGKYDQPIIKVFFDSHPSVGQSPNDAEQYKKLCEFRVKLEKDHSLYFVKFDESNCEELLRSEFTKIINYLCPSVAPAGDDKSNKVPSHHGEGPPKKDEDIKAETSSKAELEIFESIRDQLGASREVSLLDVLNRLSMLERTHLKFLLNISLSDLYGDELINNHHVNLLYKNRNNLVVSDVERYHLFRTLLHNHYDNVPGWYWLKDIKHKALDSMVVSLVLNDDSDDVRKGAVNLLALSSSFPSNELLSKYSKTRDTFILDILQDGSERVVDSAIEYLKMVGTFKDIKTIEKMAASEQICGLIAAILSKKDADKAFEYILKDGVKLAAEILSNLRGKVACEESLLTAVKHKNVDIARFALGELISRFTVPDEYLAETMATSVQEVKEICLKELIKRGKGNLYTADFIRKTLGSNISRLGGMFQFGADTDSVVRQLFESFTDEKLKHEIGWINIDANIAYEIYAKRNAMTIEEVRQDLRDDFCRLKDQWGQEVATKYGDNGTSAVYTLKNWESVEEYIRNKFRVAALNVLASNGDKSDVAMAREQVRCEDSSVREAALRIIVAHGSETDAITALEIGKNSYGNLNTVATKTYFTLAPKTEESVKVAISSWPGNAKTAVKFALQNGIAISETTISELLLNDDTNIRESAVFYLLETCTYKELIAWLDKYIKQDTYYYSVVCWLDRILFAIEPFQSIMKDKLRT